MNHIGPLGATALGEAQKANTITGHLSLQGIRQSVAAQSGRRGIHRTRRVPSRHMHCRIGCYSDVGGARNEHDVELRRYGKATVDYQWW